MRLLTDPEKKQLGEFNAAIYRIFLGAIENIRSQLSVNSGFWIVSDDSVWDELNPNPVYIECELTLPQGRTLFASFGEYPKGVTFRHGSKRGFHNINEDDAASRDEFLACVSSYVTNWINANR